MQVQTQLSRLALLAALAVILALGCAASPRESAPPQARQSGVYVEQVPVTPYMRSQVGTPNELSPLAPPQGKNMRKVDGHWYCELNGQTLRFNGATSCWEPQPK